MATAKGVFKLTLGVAVLTAAFVFVSPPLEQFESVSWLRVLGLFPLYLVLSLLVAEQFRFGAAAFGLQLPYFLNLKLSLVNSLFNLLLPFMSGSAVRCLYLRKVFDFDVKNYFKILIFILLVGVASSLLSLCFLYVFLVPDQGFVVLESAGYLASLVVIVTAVSLGFFVVKIGRSFFWSVIKVSVHWCLMLVLNAFLMVFIAAGLNAEIDVWVWLIVAFSNSVILIVNLTPGNMGVKEVIAYFLAIHLQVDAELVFLVVLVDRVLVYISVFVFGGGAIFMMWEEVRNLVRSEKESYE